MKLLLGLVSEGSGRFQVKVGKFGRFWATGYPGNQDQTLRVESDPFFDGRWHRIRAYWKSDDGAGAAALWLDDRLVFRERRTRTTGWQIERLRMGATLNQGPGHTMSLWWGRLRIWNERPDWYGGPRAPWNAR
jgi:hypothetical protein